MFAEEFERISTCFYTFSCEQLVTNRTYVYLRLDNRSQALQQHRSFFFTVQRFLRRFILLVSVFFQKILVLVQCGLLTWVHSHVFCVCGISAAVVAQPIDNPFQLFSISRGVRLCLESSRFSSATTMSCTNDRLYTR